MAIFQRQCTQKSNRGRVSKCTQQLFVMVAIVAAFGTTALQARALGPLENSDEPAADQVKRKPVITFIGFRVHDDKSSTFRVDLAASPEIKRTKKGTQVVFFMSEATIEKRNNQNPLKAQFFDSNVLNAKLDPVKGGATLTVTLRTDTITQHRIRQHQAGATLIIDVPPPADSEKSSGAPEGKK